jgi:hypothetical protein
VQLEFALLDAVTTSAHANANLAKADPLFGSILLIKNGIILITPVPLGRCNDFLLRTGIIYQL